METKVGPLCSQHWKIQQKRCLATIWPLRWCQAKYAIFLLPLFIVPPIYTIIHAWHYIRERYRIICTYQVWHTPGTVHENDTYCILNTYEYYVVLAIGAAVALPWSLVGEIKVGKIKEPQSGTITFGLLIITFKNSSGPIICRYAYQISTIHIRMYV